MAKVAITRCTVETEPEFKKVGKNETPLLTFSIMEPIRRKENGEWITKGHNHFDAKMWADTAQEAALELRKGTEFKIPEKIVRDGDNEYVSYGAYLEDESWEYQGKEYHKAVININTFEVLD